MNLFNRLLTSTLLLLSLVGCGPRKAEVRDPLVEGYRLIDAQRDDEAIDYFEDLLRADPENPDTKVALASAYAHRAKIKVQTLVPVIASVKRGSDFLKAEKREVKENEKAKRYTSADRALAKLFLSITKFGNIAQTVAMMPNILPEDRIFIEQAIQILATIQNPRPTDAVYRAMLNVVYFKHLLHFGFSGKGLFSKNIQGQCTVDVKVFTEKLMAMSQVIQSVLGDLAIAQPKQAKSMTKNREIIAEATSNLTLVTESSIVLDETSLEILREGLPDLGVESVDQCMSEESAEKPTT